MTPSDRELSPAAHLLGVAGELVLLVLATLSAWPFGGADPFWEYVLTATIALLGSLWAAHAFVTRRFQFQPDVVSVSLAGFVLLSAFQLIPLPIGAVRVLSPSRAELHAKLVPTQIERLPGEPETPPGPTFIPLSVDQYATRTFAARVLGVFVVYTAARNWLAGRTAFRRLAWVVLGNGVLLAVFALGQFLSSKDTTMYGSVDVGVRPYGPFICRNHYPDYLALCIGLAAGLMAVSSTDTKKKERKTEVVPESMWDWVFDLITTPVQVLERPVAVAAALAVGLMVVSIPFSLSRGGLVSLIGAIVFTWILGRWLAKSGSGTSGWAITLVVVVIVITLFGLGIEPLQRRFGANLFERNTDNRTAIWMAGLRQLPGYWLVGSGNGSFMRVEPLGRVENPGPIVHENAHNEYVEAIVEGGVGRSILTLMLVIGVLIRVARGYHRAYGRSSGGLLLGAWFGLSMLALHAVTDFAIHVPAIAILAAVVCGYAMALSSEDGHMSVPVKRRIKKSDSPPPVTPVPSPEQKRRVGVRSSGSLMFAILIPLVGLIITLDARSRWRADDIRVAADRVRASSTSDRFDKRVTYQTRRREVTPGDPAAWFDLAQAHLDAAVEARGTAPSFPTASVQAHIQPALYALRTARYLCPTYPAVHARLGLYASHFLQAEPSMKYLERARGLLPTDPEIWYACGVEALNAGDRATAESNWQRALELAPNNPRLLRSILKSSAGLSPSSLRQRVLTDDPWVMLEAANILFPDRENQAEERKPFLRRALAQVPVLSNPTITQLRAVAIVSAELGDLAPATTLWKRAAERSPNDLTIHSEAAVWFESQELYAEAIPFLQWLQGNPGTSTTISDRLEAAQHGVKLQERIRR